MFQNPMMKKNPFQNGFPGQGDPQGKPFQDGGFMPQGRPFQDGGAQPQGMPFRNGDMGMQMPEQAQNPMTASMQAPFQRSKMQQVLEQMGQGQKGARFGG